MKGFIVQTGDPTHTGKGGMSIWGRKFEDEFKENLKVIIIFSSFLLSFVTVTFVVSNMNRRLSLQRCKLLIISIMVFPIWKKIMSRLKIVL